MIVSQFSILEISDNGDELLMSSHCIQKKISNLKRIFDNVTSGVVALYMERSAELVCVVATLLEKRIPFAFIRTKTETLSFGAQWIFDGKQLIKPGCDETNVAYKGNILCYLIKTSGSTGVPKVVGVPYYCIQPNIEEFRERFAVSDGDVILGSTSFFFDPSIIEMFLSFVSGARLLLVSDNIRSQPHLLSSVLRKYTPSIVQLTPSVLYLLDDLTITWMLGDLSPIRCILIGGEKFPLNLVNRFRTSSNPTKIFNVYGITEVSCWATISEVPYRCERIGIGAPLKSTTLALSDDSELLIGGTRRCFINGVLSGTFTPTKDIVESRGGDYYIIGRTDDQVKVNGTLCNLSFLSEQVANLNGVSFAHFLLYKEKFLVLFVSSDSSVGSSLRGILPNTLFPSKVFYVDKVPVNSNGKTDRNHLINILEEDCSAQMKSFASALNFLKKFGIKTAIDLSFHSFVDYAAEIALYLGDVEALHDILSPHHTIANVLEKYPIRSWCTEGQEKAELWNTEKELTVIVDTQPLIKWAFNTGKCIDGTPLLVRLSEGDHVVAASHSGLVACVRASDGFCLWQIRLSCRFEASPESCGENVVIGGFNGCIYFLSSLTGSVEWSFTTGDVVKASCAVDGSSFVYVPSYDRNLYKLDVKLRKCCWSCEIQSGSPAKAVLWNNYVFVTTIKGSVEALDAMKGIHCWVYQAGAPLFSCVAIISYNGYITAVDGTVTQIRLDSGNKGLVVNVREPIFASASVFNSNIYVVTERGALFVMDEELSILRCFRFSGCSFVVSPHHLASSTLVLVSSLGLLVIFSENEEEVHGFRLGQGQVYSRVIFSCKDRYLITGNRDDWLRCLHLPVSFPKCLV